MNPLVEYLSHAEGNIGKLAGYIAAFKLISAVFVEGVIQRIGLIRIFLSSQAVLEHVRQLVHGLNHAQAGTYLEPFPGLNVVPLPGVIPIIADVPQCVRVIPVLR